MSALARILRRGLRQAVQLIPSEPWRRREPVPRPPVGPARMRLHLFSATFADAAHARAFCFAPPQADAPVQLTQELAGAFIDTAEVEVVSEPIRARLDEFLTPPEAKEVLLRMAGDNTLIIITENAFGGLPYDLDDTATLTYLGEQVVAV